MSLDETFNAALRRYGSPHTATVFSGPAVCFVVLLGPKDEPYRRLARAVVSSVSATARSLCISPEDFDVA